MLIRLWDYGWLCRDRVVLPGAATDAELIAHYLSSPAFHTSFIPNDNDETGLHGPFVAERITPADFIPLPEPDLAPYLESIKLSSKAGEDAAERAKIYAPLRTEIARGRRCYVLQRDERNRDLFHEWGYVLTVFREFLFIGTEQDSIERVVIGYD